MQDRNRNSLISQPDDEITPEERERDREADERDRAALMDAWKAFYAEHPAAQHGKWSHDYIDEERGER